ncbi:MAG TPA: hypothetical protein VLB44_06675 [Kofleriaceae bacterium]|nr:hypothetical protein [Kofleriaceae bacterium]
MLKTSPVATKILVKVDDDEVLKAVLLRPAVPHPRALPTLLEAMALWHQAPVRAVLSASDEGSWCRLGLLDELCLGADTVHYTVELRQRDRGRRQRLTGLGNFEDLRQLVLGGVR